MYYVCSNLVIPLTRPYKLSYAEMVGPSEVVWFVSHYWGMGLRHFVEAITSHTNTREAAKALDSSLPGTCRRLRSSSHSRHVLPSSSLCADYRYPPLALDCFRLLDLHFQQQPVAGRHAASGAKAHRAGVVGWDIAPGAGYG